MWIHIIGKNIPSSTTKRFAEFVVCQKCLLIVRLLQEETFLSVIKLYTRKIWLHWGFNAS